MDNNMATRFLSSDDEETSDALFNIAIATIFAREFLEGAVIVGNYRAVIQRNDGWDEETKKRALKTVTWSAVMASVFAILVAIALIIPLAVLSKDLNDTTIMIIEGISKVVASICILQLSVKIPAWLGLYWKVSILPWKNNEIKHTDSDVISFNEIRFNVAWNIWREVAECGVFLIPFFLGSGAKAIPVSALAGVAVALVLGLGIFTANNRLKSKVSLAFFMSALTLFLATGLFVGGCHEFEEVWGETREVWAIENPNMSAKELPMAIFKPFGYSSSRTVLQICCFWLFLGAGLAYHTLKYRNTKDMQQRYAAAYPEKSKTPVDIEKQSEETGPKSEEEAPDVDEQAPPASSEA